MADELSADELSGAMIGAELEISRDTIDEHDNS